MGEGDFQFAGEIVLLAQIGSPENYPELTATVVSACIKTISVKGSTCRYSEWFVLQGFSFVKKRLNFDAVMSGNESSVAQTKTPNQCAQ